MSTPADVFRNKAVLSGIRGLGIFDASFFDANGGWASRLVESWPKILNWMQYLFEVNFVREVGIQRKIFASSIPSAFECFQSCPGLAARALQDNSLIEFAVKLWVNDPMPDTRPYMSTSLVTCLQLVGYRQRALSVVREVLGSWAATADLALERVRTVSQLTPTNYKALLPHVQSLAFLFQATGHPLRPTIVGRGAIPLACSVVSRALADADSESTERMHIIYFLSEFVNLALNRPAHIKQALDNGLFDILLAHVPYLEQINADHHSSLHSIAFNIIPAYLCMRSVSKAAHKAFKGYSYERFVASTKHGKDRTEAFKKKWSALERHVADRTVSVRLDSRSSESELARCANVSVSVPFDAAESDEEHTGFRIVSIFQFLCNKLVRRLELKQCAGCRTAKYCSYVCEKIAWRSQEHRKRCEAIGLENQDCQCYRSPYIALTNPPYSQCPI